MKLLAISDLHLGHDRNRAALEELGDEARGRAVDPDRDDLLRL